MTSRHDRMGYVVGHDDDIPRRIPLIQDMTLADFPAEIGLFPLDEVMLLPHGKLPLNVFEPRYVALVEDAMRGERMIGMIQPRDWPGMESVAGVSGSDVADGSEDPPELYSIGCVGRITSMTERADGTYGITLTGLARFRLLREAGVRRGYRVARIDVSGFAADVTDPDEDVAYDRERLLESLRRFCARQGLNTQWDALYEMDDATLLVTLPMICPFAKAEKQALLESATLAERAHTLRTLLDMAGHEPDEGASPS
ncbi:peptidase [Novacetimonas maltaceti]|uniref:ATP-dependent protease La (LON) domain protein n=1 Tax=Novacetimonas maltaceti TaxID=1203393 RepID=A0A2S3W3V4_9PROT|nr:LON peptidase substrate-binding domain-containing protein [Novacetimonas maltaceti]POF63552.1 ATP-dependent protease La (LON) domain protein [Novacetimonas maltaceti]PYD59824.1 peptidase [Novacetimonas maltaceti]